MLTHICLGVNIKLMIALPTGTLDPSAEIIGFVENEINYRELNTPADFRLAYEFRYRICVQKMHWIDGNPDTQTESDEFDEYSYHFGAFQGDVIIGYCRLTPDDVPSSTMTRKYFSDLLHHGTDYPSDGAADISRLIIDMDYIGKNKLMLKRILTNIYRLVYGRSELAHPAILRWYFVTTPILMKGLRYQLWLPVTEIGKGITPDGKTTHLATIDLRAARNRLRIIAPLHLWKFARTKRLLIKP